MTKTSLPHATEQVEENRQRFIASARGDLARTALVYVTFDGDDYCRYRPATPRIKCDDNVASRCVSDNRQGRRLFLPLADCCGRCCTTGKTC